MNKTNELLKQSWDAHQVSANDDAFELLHEAVREIHAAQTEALKRLNVAIAFHQANENDPHGIGNAVICALSEVRTALSANTVVSHEHGEDNALKQPKA